MIGFKTTSDTITPYFEHLEKEINNSYNRNKPLKNIARDVVDMATDVVPKMNPNLMHSGKNEGFWKIKHQEDKSDLTILYTGFTGEGVGEPDDIYVWWEFGKYHKGGYSDILGRDYAEYQEIGIDTHAPNSKYKAPSFEGHHYLETAIIDSEDSAEYYAEQYLKQLMNIK